MSDITIRAARVEDAADILKIYGYYVENTAVTFEYDVPSLEEFQKRISDTLKKYPYLVAVRDGEIVGYTYAGAFHKRAAFQWSAELSVYLDRSERGRGTGRRLYETIEARLADMGIVNLYALIASTEKEDEYLTNHSTQFHEHMGYRKVGELHKCGLKFGRWYNMRYMEKYIGEHCSCDL